MNFSIFKTRFILYLALLAVASWFLFNFLLNRQSAIMYDYFIERPASYNLERAERLSSSIYKSFKQEISSPSLDNIRLFIKKYDDIPFLSVDFVYEDEGGLMQSMTKDVQEIDILNAEYVYPIRYGNKEIGTLLVFDINKEYKKGLEEYNHMLNVERVFFGILMLLISALLLFREYSIKIEHDKKIAEYEAVHDGLTGLYTQKYFKKSLAKEIARSQRYKRPLSLIMCDIDLFKRFNDTYGHLAGDKALKTVAHIIGVNVRKFDIVARYGGEEFAVLLMEAGSKEALSIAARLKDLTDEAIEVADRIKDKIAQAEFQVDHTTVNVTISMGVCSFNGDTDYKADYLISGADQALYESKKSGRNKITLLNPETKEFSTHE